MAVVAALAHMKPGSVLREASAGNTIYRMGDVLRIILIATVLIAIVGLVTGGPGSTPGAPSSPPAADRLAVEVQRSRTGFVIRALTSGLSQCRARLNGEYTANIPTLPIGLDMPLDLAQMTLSDGRRFNQITHAPQRLYLVCDLPTRRDASFSIQ